MIRKTAALMLAFGATRAFAAILEVPGEFESIRAAITDSQSGDTIRVAHGTYDEIGLVARQPVTLLGDPGDPASVVIDGRGLGRILHLNAAGQFRVEGITFLGGNASDINGTNGGGIFSNISEYTVIRNCRFVDCTAVVGGGAAILAGTARVQDCDFEGNQGSGLYTQGTDLELFDCRFSGNRGLYGGAYRQNTGSAVVDGCRFEDNRAEFRGGALSMATGFVYESAFLENRADTGGAIDANNLVGGHLSLCGNRARLGSAIHMRYRTQLFDSILAHGQGEGIVYSTADSNSSLLQVECCCLYPAIPGDWANHPVEPGEESLVFGDPLFCDAGAGDLGLAQESPCLPAVNPCSGRIGLDDAVVCRQAAVRADFQPGQDWVLVGHPMRFTDLSSFWATRWNWDFDGDGFTDSNEQDPLWVFGQEGSWTVTLEAGQGLDSDSFTLEACVTSYRPRVLRVPEVVRELEDALEQAVRGDTISVACGTYTIGPIRLPSGVALVGRTGNPECVVLDAGQAGRVFELAGADSSTLIEGLTITGGLANGTGIDGTGGAMLLDGASPRVKNCILRGNSATLGGAVSIAWNSHPVFEACTFAGNQSSSLGSAVISSGDTGLFERCILWGNTGGAAVFGGPELRCSDIHGNPGGDWTGEIADQATQQGNLGLDPQFCDPQDGRFRLEADSPCYDAVCGVLGANPLDCAGTGLEPPVQPESAELLLCYPNPFNARLGIRYDPPSPGALRIRLLDLAGRTVGEWSGHSRDGSPAHMTLDGEGLASGVYFVQFEAGSQREIRKVMLIK
jgi:PKD repeat protein